MSTEFQNNNIITRTINVNITGSLSNFAMAGPLGGIWKPVDGKQTKVFGTLSDNADAQVVMNQLRTALIHEVVLLEHKSTFPVPLGANINCIPPQEFTDLGQGFSYTILPNSTISTPHVIYKCDANAENSLNWRMEYPRWNATNLEKEGVMDVANCPYVFVSQDHPIIALLRSNSSLIGCNIDDQPKIDNEWFKVTRQVLAACCQTLRSKVLSKISSNDMTTFQLQVERIGTETWDDITEPGLHLQTGCNPNNVDDAKTAAQNFISTPYSYMARIQIKYEIQNPN
jgi:hypothetical protein